MSSILPKFEAQGQKVDAVSFELEDSSSQTKAVTTSFTLLHEEVKPTQKGQGHIYTDNMSGQEPSRKSSETAVSSSSIFEDSDSEPRRVSVSIDEFQKSTWKLFWLRNKGMALVFISQLFGAFMSVTTRLLETTGTDIHPFQIIFARMSITALVSCVYMYWAKVPYFPLGMPGIRRLLVLRGISGFFGVYGLYYSLLYLPLAEATVITFLAPLAACWACSILMHEPFTGSEQIAGLISLLGVVLIARPVSIISSFTTAGPSSPPPASGTGDIMTGSSNVTAVGDHHAIVDVTPAQRISAVGVSVLGVMGAACAYTTIRQIGKRAHPLLSVNYFAVWCTVVSATALLFLPSMSFQLPANIMEWTLLLALGIFGVIMQLLLTAGLQSGDGNRATNMVYSQMLFALAFDKIVWGTTPGLWAIFGSLLILGSVVYVAVGWGKSGYVPVAKDEEAAALGQEEETGEHGSDEESGRRIGTQAIQLRSMGVR